MCFSLWTAPRMNIRSFITSFMYRNAILGNLTGATCISLIFLSPSASCAAEHAPWPAAEMDLRNRHNNLSKEFLKISFLACLGHGWRQDGPGEIIPGVGSVSFRRVRRVPGRGDTALAPLLEALWAFVLPSSSRAASQQLHGLEVKTLQCFGRLEMFPPPTHTSLLTFSIPSLQSHDLKAGLHPGSLQAL